jgi:hypothetical protein
MERRLLEDIPLEVFNATLLKAVRAALVEAEAAQGTDAFEPAVAEAVVYLSMVVNRNGMVDRDFMSIVVDKINTVNATASAPGSHLRVVK